jgi:20S proteasome subunit beta 2
VRRAVLYALRSITQKEKMTGGFNFENVQRNLSMKAGGSVPPKMLKTGTTIVGCTFAGGVVLGADTRATEGTTVADKRCMKIHYMAPNIRCCGAGTAADTEMVTQMIAAELTLERMESGKQTKVNAALSRLKAFLYKYQGHIGAALVLGGVDVDGPFLASCAPHGSTDRLPFATMGSGSLAAMGVLETGFKDDMTEEEAKGLVTAAIAAGIMNDPYSGSVVDLSIVTKNGVETLLEHKVICERVLPKVKTVLPIGTAPVTKTEMMRLSTVTDVPLSED